MTRVAVLQPTYLPWLGYLDLVDQVDHLVLLDDVGFSKQSWQQRNRIKTQAGLVWLTVPVKTRGALGALIRDIAIAEPGFWRKHWKTLEQAYARAPHFAEHAAGLRDVYERGDPWSSLAELDVALLRWLLDAYGIATPVERASELPASGRRGARVASLCGALGAREYVSPAGAADYLGEDRAYFEHAGVSVSLQRYAHPVYRQLHGEFVEKASALDLLFCEGPEALAILRSGRRAPEPLAPPPGDGAFAPARAELAG